MTPTTSPVKSSDPHWVCMTCRARFATQPELKDHLVDGIDCPTSAPIVKLHRPGQSTYLTFLTKSALFDAADYQLFQIKTVHSNGSETLEYAQRWSMPVPERAVQRLFELGAIGEISEWERINEWQYRRRLDLSKAGLDLRLEFEE